ncbi:MAG: hypothetical protein UMU75_06860 [Halomonas sp.]|nr:hypothetical protein [Halomonas sp.]
MKRSWTRALGGATLMAALAFTATAQAEEEAEWNRFGEWDVDASGDISEEEWGAGLDRFEAEEQNIDDKTGVEENEENAIFSLYQDYNAVDTNDDERVDEEEFEQFQSGLEEEE